MKTLIYFSAPWCSTCEEFEPIVDEIASDIGIEITKVNVEDQPKKAAKHDINVIPCIIVLEEEKVIKKLVGKKNKEDITNFL